jgi:transcriptional regulator with XRE-family HTH domain
MINPRVIQVYKEIEEGKAPMRVIRDQLGLTQPEFAVRLGVGVSTVSRWENGLSPVTLTIRQIKTFELMLQEVGITLQQLPDDLGLPRPK